MEKSVCTVVRKYQNSEEIKQLQSEVKLACTILNKLSELFWNATSQEIVEYISHTENQFSQFKLIEEKTEEIQKHLKAFSGGKEEIDDTRLWVELFAEDFRKAERQLA